MSQHRIEIYRAATEDGDPEYRWRKVAANGEIVAQGEGHTRRWTAIRAAVKANPDVWREDFVDADWGGRRLRSAQLDKVPSKTDEQV